MKSGISRRQFHAVLGWGVASIALSEFGLAHRSVAEENFTLASTGATWGEGLRASFVDRPKFEDKTGVKVTQEFAIDSDLTVTSFAVSALNTTAIGGVGQHLGRFSLVTLQVGTAPSNPSQPRVSHPTRAPRFSQIG